MRSRNKPSSNSSKESLELKSDLVMLNIYSMSTALLAYTTAKGGGPLDYFLTVGTALLTVTTSYEIFRKTKSYKS